MQAELRHKWRENRQEIDDNKLTQIERCHGKKINRNIDENQKISSDPNIDKMLCNIQEGTMTFA